MPVLVETNKKILGNPFQSIKGKILKITNRDLKDAKTDRHLHKDRERHGEKHTEVEKENKRDTNGESM